MLSNEQISVVIPAFNEADKIGLSIDTIWKYLNGRFKKFEIIVVDDGSTDNTSAIVSSLADDNPAIKLIRLPQNRGKGASVREGMLSASSNLILMCDADLSAPIEELEKLLPWMQEGFEIIAGSRAIKGSEIVVRQPWFRERMGKIFGMLARMIVIGGIMDMQCGFKLFTKQAANDIFTRARVDRFAFDVEALFLARKMGYQIKEVPITWSHSQNTKVRLLIDSLYMAFDLVRIRMYNLAGYYISP